MSCVLNPGCRLMAELSTCHASPPAEDLNTSQGSNVCAFKVKRKKALETCPASVCVGLCVLAKIFIIYDFCI